MRRLLFSVVCTAVCAISFAQEIATEREKVFNGVNSLEVNADFCALKISGHDSKKVNFKGVIKSAENKEAYGFEFIEQDGVLKVDVVKPVQWKSHWGEIVLNVPEGISIKVTSQSGKTEVTDLKGVDINLVSKSGHVVLKSVIGSVSTNSPAGDLSIVDFKGDLKSKTKSGAVVINKLQGIANIGCSKGAMTITDVQGNLIVDGGTGNMEVENVKGKISLKSTSGDTKLSIAEGDITCKIFDGDMKLFNTKGTFQVQSSTGNITGTRVQFVASSSIASTEGNIKVQMSNKDNLAFVLKSNNSYLRAMGKSKKKSLKIGKGDIVVTGTSTTGSQAYY